MVPCVVARPISIRSSLLRDIAVLVVLLGLGMFVATLIGSRRMVRSLSESLVGQTLTTVESKLDELFGEAEQQLSVAVGQGKAGALDIQALDPIGAIDESQFEAQRQHRNRLFRPIVETSPQISSLMLADTNGREHMLLLFNGVWRNRCSAADEWTEVRWLEWSDEVAPTVSREAMDYDTRQRPWFIGALQTGPGTVHWTEPYTFFTTNEPGITISAAFDMGDGVQRVLGFDVLLNDISEFTRELGIGERGLVAVLSEDGRFVGLPGIEGLDEPAARTAAYLKLPEELGLTLIDDAVKTRGGPASRDSVTYRFHSAGEAWWASAQPYALSDGRQLRIAILMPEADLLGDVRLLRLIIISLVVVVLALGGLRAVFVARRFSAPVEGLVEQSARITSGDLESESHIDSPIKEIQRLVEAQDHMREGILARIKLQKVERDLDLAREIQQGLLPQLPPEAQGFEIAGWNQPADQTGGDFYDWLSLPDGRVVLTLADVTGHGIGPALIVAVYRAYVRASTTFGIAALAAAFENINDLLCADLPQGKFITAVVGVLDPQANRMRMVSAGHGPLLYYQAASGTVQSWNADGPPLGIVEGLEFDAPRDIEFSPGDILVLVTDGFFEWANEAGELFGTDRLEAFVRANSNLAPAAFIHALHEAVLDHAGGTVQGDDLTALVIRKT